MISAMSDMTIGHWVELGISGVVLVAIGVALWIMSRQFQFHNEEITKRNEDISKREENLLKESTEAMNTVHDMFMKEQEATKKWMESQQKTMEGWIKGQTKAINEVASTINNSALPKKYTPEQNQQNIEARKYLSRAVEHVHQATKSSRTMLCMFHNGTHSLNNVSFYKFSLIGESWDINLAPVGDRIKDCQVVVYAGLIDMLENNKKGLVVKNVDDLKGDVATYQFFVSRGTKCVMAQAIYNDEDTMMVGFLLNEYMDLHPEWDEKTWHSNKIIVTRAADRLSAVFGASSVDEEIREEKKKGGNVNAE